MMSSIYQAADKWMKRELDIRERIFFFFKKETVGQRTVS